MKNALKRRITKLDATLSPPRQIVIQNVYETPGLTSERFVSRQQHGNVVVETWEGPMENPSQEQYALRVLTSHISAHCPVARA
jgi:hypothetical protein